MGTPASLFGYSVHPACAAFPLLDGDRLAELAEDIGAHGLIHPVVVQGETILDGRNRLLACERAGVDPRFEQWDGIDPVAWIVSVNLHRRHLTESQRAMVAARLRLGLPGRGRGRPVADAENSPNSDEFAGDRAGRAADLLNVSRASVASAATVLAQGTPSLVDAVDRGAVRVSTAADIATLPPTEQEEIVARGEVEILRKAKEIRARKNDRRREERLGKLRQIETGNDTLDTSRRYPVIYADPPWRYEYAETENRAIENQYPTMDADAIAALPVVDLANDDAILFLWATSPKLAEAMQVIEGWGFAYRTCMVWVKDRVGMGYYARQRHELLLIATRGSIPAPAPADRPDSVIEAPRGEHSAKPARVYEMIEAMYPGLARIELFARSAHPGWDRWGNQAGRAA